MTVRDQRLAWVEAKLRECRRIALRYFHQAKSLQVELKPDRSPVTIADRTLEERLRREISRAFPGEAIVGEEFGQPKDLGHSYWTIDPIDGTRGFSRGLPSWGILLSYVERGRPVLGACDYPAVSRFLGGSRLTPAYESADGRRIRLPRVVPRTDLSNTVIFHGGSSWWLPTKYGRGFTKVVTSCFLERSYGDCYSYLWLFRGHADAKLDYGVKIWDVAPFYALASITGRVMIDCSGQPSFTGPESILAHPSLAKKIAAVLSSKGR